MDPAASFLYCRVFAHVLPSKKGRTKFPGVDLDGHCRGVNRRLHASLALVDTDALPVPRSTSRLDINTAESWTAGEVTSCMS